MNVIDHSDIRGAGRSIDRRVRTASVHLRKGVGPGVRPTSLPLFGPGRRALCMNSGVSNKFFASARQSVLLICTCLILPVRKPPRIGPRATRRGGAELRTYPLDTLKVMPDIWWPKVIIHAHTHLVCSCRTSGGLLPSQEFYLARAF